MPIICIKTRLQDATEAAAAENEGLLQKLKEIDDVQRAEEVLPLEIMLV